MEVTNDKLLLAFRIKTPLRCLLGCQETLQVGQPCVAMAINRYTHALVQVFQPERDGPKSFALRFLVRSSNKIVFDYTVRSRSEVINLTLEDPPEVKLVKHIFKNDTILGPQFLKAIKADPSLQFTINVKLECDMGLDRGLGGSAGYSLSLACSFILGLKAAFGLLQNLDSFLEEKTNIGSFAMYADYLEQQIHEERGKQVEKQSGLDVAMLIQGGLIAFSPQSQERATNQILALDHYLFTANYSLVLINANRKPLKPEIVRSKASSDAFESLKELSEELTGFFVSQLGVAWSGTSFDHDSLMQMLSQLQELYMKYIDADHSDQYDELKEILRILGKAGYQGVIQGQMILALTRLGQEESTEEQMLKERNCKEALLERELRKSYFSLYGKIAISGDGLYIDSLNLE